MPPLTTCTRSWLAGLALTVALAALLAGMVLLHLTGIVALAEEGET